jgi:hypothetical protein
LAGRRALLFVGWSITVPYRDQFSEDPWGESDLFAPHSEEEDGVETVLCPYCRKPVYEEADRCPSCGNYLSGKDEPRRPAPWFAITVFVCLVIVAGWIMGGC